LDRKPALQLFPLMIDIRFKQRIHNLRANGGDVVLVDNEERVS